MANSFGTGLLQGIGSAMQARQLMAEKQRQLRLQKRQIKLAEEQMKLKQELSQDEAKRAMQRMAMEQRRFEWEQQQGQLKQQQQQTWNDVLEQIVSRQTGLGAGQPQGGTASAPGMEIGSVRMSGGDPSIELRRSQLDKFASPEDLMRFRDAQGKPPPYGTKYRDLARYQMASDLPSQAQMEDVISGLGVVDTINKMDAALAQGAKTGPAVGPAQEFASRTFGVETGAANYGGLSKNIGLSLGDMLIKGTPSDVDLERIDAITPSTSYSPEHNQRLHGLIRQKVETAIKLRIGALKGSKTPIPLALQKAALDLGVNINKVQANENTWTTDDILGDIDPKELGQEQRQDDGMSDEEYQRRKRALLGK